MKNLIRHGVFVGCCLLALLVLGHSAYAQGNKSKKESSKKESTKKKTNKDDDTPASVGSGNVYICDSEGAEAYHTFKDCGALGRCKSEVKRVTKKDAQSKGRKMCQICAKKD